MFDRGKVNIATRYKEYKESNEWKCDKSPTNAHFWVIEKPKFKDNLQIDSNRCKYCDKEKIVVRKDH